MDLWFHLVFGEDRPGAGEVPTASPKGGASRGP